MTDNKCYTINYDNNLKALLIKWKEISFGKDYREIFNRAKDLIKDKSSTKLILDVTEGYENELEDTEWVYKEFINSMKNTSIHTVYLLVNKSNSLCKEISNESEIWEKDFKIFTCNDLNEITNS